MKENNSLTCAKTVQKQPFLMSDTSRPPDAFYVSNSLIKQHPRERDRGDMKSVCECTCVCITCGVWIVRYDFVTLIFTQQGSITLVVVLFIVFSSDNLPDFFLRKAVGFFFFWQALNIKRVKSKKWNSLQWGVLPAKEWGGVRILNYCRCALLENNSVIYIFFLKCHLQLTMSLSIFCSGCFCQIVKLRRALRFILSQTQKNIIANLLINVFFQHLSQCFVIIFKNQTRVVILKRLNGNLLCPHCCCVHARAADSLVFRLLRRPY